MKLSGLVLIVAVLGGASLSAWGQAPANTPAPKPAPAAAAASADDKPAFKQEELDQMMAPIALYPDSLLSQIFMASTYPIEIVEADRWVKANKEVKGDAAAKALEAKDWDPSVKSLVNFPDVLAMLSDRLDWTQKVGDAFIGQQKEVMDTVQKLRGKAKEAGKLESTKEQNVKVEQQGSTQTIVIESTSPEVIYVPSYNPTVVYGTWPYPSYPPYPYYPPGYVASNVMSFGVGVACGLAWGYAWGHCDWNNCDVDIDVNRNNNFNRNIDRSKYSNRAGNRGTWQHDASHRRGVGYRDSASAQRFGGKSATQTAKARESYRGRADQGRRDIATRGPDAVRNSGPTRSNTGAQRPSTAPSRSTADRPAANRSSNSGGAMRGVDRGGSSARASSSRGHSSGGGRATRGGGGGGGRRR